MRQLLLFFIVLLALMSVCCGFDVKVALPASTTTSHQTPEKKLVKSSATCHFGERTGLPPIICSDCKYCNKAPTCTNFNGEKSIFNSLQFENKNLACKLAMMREHCASSDPTNDNLWTVVSPSYYPYYNPTYRFKLCKRWTNKMSSICYSSYDVEYDSDCWDDPTFSFSEAMASDGLCKFGELVGKAPQPCPNCTACGNGNYPTCFTYNSQLQMKKLINNYGGLVNEDCFVDVKQLVCAQYHPKNQGYHYKIWSPFQACRSVCEKKRNMLCYPEWYNCNDFPTADCWDGSITVSGSYGFFQIVPFKIIFGLFVLILSLF
ncbi:predicted protein [Naegleria gruberi]|uniref:Predicted protein n=1 Tax=Naegleria gruberi TaxID=5762 RepID=D2VBL7_NAEGR|nr:uncharacterized protein NAEGRDRAFT_66260 [Naegleria gruberi]EFC45817.1 predicted protein [Naegleria gruberi]|eukprot:XP_002678561.1 predicted protein [Naegleria gruberi strain NEG-M]